jgi:hypothetical protein
LSPKILETVSAFGGHSRRDQIFLIVLNTLGKVEILPHFASSGAKMDNMRYIESHVVMGPEIYFIKNVVIIAYVRNCIR